MGIGKVVAILTLGMMSIATIISGLWFTNYSFKTHNSVLVFGNKIPGLIFGLAALYLGVRAFIKVYRLRNKLKQPDVVFKWNNFAKK